MGAIISLGLAVIGFIVGLYVVIFIGSIVLVVGGWLIISLIDGLNSSYNKIMKIVTGKSSWERYLDKQNGVK